MSIWYNGGTLAVESGSTSVVGTGTLFLTQTKDGDMLFTLQGGTLRLNQITARADDTHFTIEPAWDGATASGLAYYIVATSPDWGEVSAVANDLATFLANRATFFPTTGKPDNGLGGDGSFAVDPNSTPPLLYKKAAGAWDNGTSLGGPKGDTGSGYGGTSSDTKTLVSSGSMSFTTQAGLAWQAGSRIRMASATAPTTKWMEGIITSYSSTTLVVTIDKQGSGSGSASDWTFSPAGIPGEKGDTPKFSGTSTDSKAIATGSVTVATQSDLAFAIGSRVTLASAANSANFMQGLITAYSAGSMTVNVDLVGGSGTFADWVITLVGARGATGSQGLGYGGTSTTSRAIGSSGTMTWTIGTGKAYQVGDLVKVVVSTDVTQWMKGKVSGYSAGVLSVDISEKGPTSSGTYASWNIGLAGETGQQGIQGDPGNDGSDGVSPTYNATSASTLTPATGSKDFTVASGLSFVAGQRVRAASSANLITNWMSGIVASYSSTTLTVTVDLIGASPASASDWNISITGEKGDQGPAGGFGSLSAAKGNFPIADGSTFGIEPVGADGNILQADSSQTHGIVSRSVGAALAAGLRARTDIASAATCDIGAAATDYVNITGTAAITSFGTAANKIRRVRFAGALTLTYNGTSLVLPGLANITTAAGDEAEFASDGSGNWKCRAYLPASGYSKKGSDVVSIKRQVFTSSGTYTPSAGMLYIDVEMVGGGASGGGVGASGGPTSYGSAAGGGAGEYARGVFSAADIGASQTVTIGAGGAAPTAGANNGNAGGTTSLGSLLTASGGVAGAGATSGTSSVNTSGSLGGSSGTGTGLHSPGGASGTSITVATGTNTQCVALGGYGGSSYFGSGGKGGQANVFNVVAAATGLAYGTGGGGGANGNSGAAISGGAGAPGVMIITEYCSQ